MSKIILQSHHALMCFTRSGYSASALNAELMAGVIGSDFTITTNRSSQKQVGSYLPSINDPIRQPEIEVGVEYYLTPNFLNENYLGMVDVPGTAKYPFSGYEPERYHNLIYLMHPEQTGDALDAWNNTTAASWTGFTSLGIGNAFLTSYSVNYSVGAIPTVRASFIASNMQATGMFNATTPNPSINLESGGGLGGDITVGEGTFDYRSDPSVVIPGEVILKLDNLQIGGQPISGNHFIQSLQLDIPITRSSSYGLGSDYVYTRKINYPLVGTITLNSYVSGFDTGFLSGLLYDEKGYFFDISFYSSQLYGDADLWSGVYKIYNAVLENVNYSLITNDEMIMNAQFSVSITPQTGLQLEYTTWP